MDRMGTKFPGSARAKRRPIGGWKTLMHIKGEMSLRGNSLVRGFAYAGFCSYSGERRWARS